MLPVVFVVGRAGNTQADYDNEMFKSQPFNVNKFWTDHLPKGTPLLVTQWNLGIFKDGPGHILANANAIAALIAQKFPGVTTRVNLVGHSFGGGTAIALAKMLYRPNLFLIDPVDPESPNVPNTGFTAPSGCNSITTWYRGAKEMPWSSLVTAIGSLPMNGTVILPTNVRNIFYPPRPTDSVMGAHGRGVWDGDIVKVVATAA